MISLGDIMDGYGPLSQKLFRKNRDMIQCTNVQLPQCTNVQLPQSVHLAPQRPRVAAVRFVRRVPLVLAVAAVSVVYRVALLAWCSFVHLPPFSPFVKLSVWRFPFFRLR